MSIIAGTVSTCIKDSNILLNLLTKIGKISLRFFLFLADTVIMHASITTECGLEVIRLHDIEFRHGIPAIFLVEAVLEGLNFVMHNTFF